MNVIITLPENLIELILSGEKLFEMRKCLPARMEIGEDGFFAIEKGTDKVRCWCRVDHVTKLIMTTQLSEQYSPELGVSPEFILDYAPVETLVYMWRISKVVKLDKLSRESFYLRDNPQSFVYCPWSYGEPFFNNL